MSDWFQWAIVAFIVLSILWHVWKGGSANPEGTGSLGRKVNGLSTEVATLSGRVRHVEAGMKKLEQEAATSKEIEKLEQLVDERLKTVRAEIQGHQAVSQATNDSVRRIERLLIEKGLGK